MIQAHDATERIELNPVLARLDRLRSVMGVTRVAEVTGLDRIGIPVWNAVRPNARNIAVASGKGMTDERAKLGALMEAWERYAAEHGVVELRRGSARTLARRHRLLDLDRIACIPGRRHDGDAIVGWTEGIDLARQEHVLVPCDLVTNDFCRPCEQAAFWRRSDGLAAHTERGEAILNGLLELIERDAYSRWRRSTPVERGEWRIDPQTIQVAPLRHILDMLGQRHFEVTLWGTLGRAHLPVCIAALRDRAGESRYGPTFGTACARGWDDAIRDAVLEAVQSRMAFVTGTRDDLDETAYEAGRRGLMALLGECLFAGGKPARRYAELAQPPAETRSLEQLVAELARLGFDSVVVVDIASERPGPAVVRVIVPGLDSVARTRVLRPSVPLAE